MNYNLSEKTIGDGFIYLLFLIVYVVKLKCRS